jgi:hypothetical protein
MIGTLRRDGNYPYRKDTMNINPSEADIWRDQLDIWHCDSCRPGLLVLKRIPSNRSGCEIGTC